ncbi:MAG: protein kinase [Burkholderiales bacterium]|nr:protein kinase [Burkholderiales bacterium]
MNSSSTPPAVPGDSVPGSPQSVPGVALWSDSDSGRPAAPGFSGLVAPAADRAMPTIGHIGRYALKYQLGAGGLGTVFAAHDPLLSRLIAVKTLNLEIKENERESFNSLFINEARAAGGLSHPHIVTVFDAGISDNRAYIAMELLKGRDLRQLRQEGWRATPSQAALIVRRVADALAFAHSKGVIHRDIKPANIFMVGRTQPRVLDFGIARITHQREGGDAMNGAGSPYYMAPEQVRREPGDRRTDVFSLGVVLYELLTDTKPFDGESLKDITNAVLEHEPPLASKVDKAVPRALAEIAARAMAKDPEHRFRSARSFARELRQWLDANPVGPEGEALAGAPEARQSPRRRAPWIAAAVLAVVGLGSAAVWWQGSAPAQPTVAAGPAGRTALPTAAARSPAPAVAAAPASALAAGPSPAVAAEPAVTIAPASPVATTTPAAPAAQTAMPQPAAAQTAAAPIPNGANNPAAQEALLLASIVPTPSLVTATTAAPMPSATVPSAKEVQPKESAKERRAREAKDREARERDLRLAAAQPAIAATGLVRIAISPWGQVEVDGAASGAAPPLTELNLSEGRHQIVVRNGDFAPFVATVNVVAGQTLSIRHKFGS